MSLRPCPAFFVLMALVLCGPLRAGTDALAEPRVPEAGDTSATDSWVAWTTSRADTSSFALVLGGGGVRGFAHIGVLQVLEEEGLRPGLIVGTSMGAVVGALYACGYSAARLEKLVQEEDWLQLFSYRRPPVAELQGGWPGLPPAQLSLLAGTFPPMPPPSLARGQAVENLLGRLTAGPLFSAGNDFDRLPIPFRAVAVDVNTGEKVILSRGSLATAVRASGTVPLILPPVEWNGRMLVDGGFRANNPVEVARALGFSRSIVVDVSNVFVPGKSTPRNLMEMWVRAMELQQYEGNVVDPRPGELVLHLPLQEYRSLEFGDAADIVRVGYREADRLRERLRAFAPRTAAPTRAFPRMVTEDPGFSPVRVDSLDCADVRGMSRAEICRRLRLRPGAVLAPGEIWKRVEPLSVAPGVERAWVEIEPLGKGPKDGLGNSFRRPDSRMQGERPSPDDVPGSLLRLHLRVRRALRWELAGHVISDDTAALLVRLRQARLPGGGEAALSWRTSHRTAAAGLRFRQGLPPGGSFGLAVEAHWSRDRPWVYQAGETIDRWAIVDASGNLALDWRLPRSSWRLSVGIAADRVESYRESRSTPGSGRRSLAGWRWELSSGGNAGLVQGPREGVRLSYRRGLPKWGDLDLWRWELGAIGQVETHRWLRPEGALGAVIASRETPVEFTGRAGGPLGWVGLRREEILSPRLAWARGALSARLGSTLRLVVSSAVGWHDDRDLGRAAPLWAEPATWRWAWAC